ELLRQQPPGHAELRPGQGRIDEQLARVVARLAMDVHRAGVVRSPAVLVPEAVLEPCVRLRQEHQIAGPRMVEADFPPFLTGEHATDAGKVLEGKDRIDIATIPNIHMRDLMVTYREGPAAERIELLAE